METLLLGRNIKGAVEVKGNLGNDVLGNYNWKENYIIDHALSQVIHL